MNHKLIMAQAIVLLSSTLNSAAAQANSISVSTPKPAIVLDGGDMGKRVCYYEDKAYSEGAVLQVGEVYMLCQRASQIETNGPLKWRVFKAPETKTP
ncbi:DUF1496 domain-containing protein [Vibrio ostreae]|nr:DUF1496 domain-containing protein [Vibrio ostreae]